MTRHELRDRRRRRGEWLLTFWGIAVVPNALVAFGVSLDGWGWDVLRVLLTIPMAVALVLWLGALVQELRAPRPRQRRA